MTDTATVIETHADLRHGGRRRGPARWIALGIAVPFLAFVVVLATRPAATSRVADSPLVGRPAPEITAPTIDGDTVRLSTYRGRWVLLNVFATWCVPCRKEHSDLVAFHQRHQATGDAAVVGLVYDDTAEAVRDFRAGNGGDWPMLVDPDGSIALDLGVAGVPESFLISPDGIVVSKIVGGVRDADLESLLSRAQAQS